jgi:shikimate 5-dehydrogenase
LICNNQSARNLAEFQLRRGLAITVPYKAAVIPLIDAVGRCG